MKLMTRVLTVALTALSVLFALTVPAQAASPSKGGTYEGEGPNVVKVAKNGKSVKQFFFQTSLSQCSPMPSKTGPVKPKIKDGKFTWKGQLTSVTGDKKTYTIKGSFKTKKKLVV